MTRAAAAGLTRVRRWVGAGVLAGGSLVLAAVPALGQEAAPSQRFSIGEVQDTTFTFTIGRTGWVKPKQRGIAVDAARRDALVARFSVLAVRGGVATALVTGATTRVSPAHTVVMVPPRQRWYRSRYFWSGAIGGLLGGAAAGIAIR